MMAGSAATGFGIRACNRPLTEFPNGKGLPLPHLPLNPEGRGILNGLFLEKTLFLGMPCLQSLLR